MYQVETDSDDDYECLFLKPVNGYNLAEKIRQANEELFASPGPKSPSVLPRRVTFRRILEDYDDGGDNISIVSIDSADGNNSNNESKPKEKLKHIPEIEEEDKHETIVTESETEEICEEIIEINLDTESKQTLQEEIEVIVPNTKTNTTKSKKEEEMIKNRPKSPPLSRNREERNPIKFQEISLNSPTSSFDKTVMSPSSSEDDLSVIVASYLPDGFEVIEEKSSEDNDENKKIKSKKFSFRKKKKSESNQDLKKNSKQKSKNKNKTNETDETDEMKFHYKTCCEYKNSVDTNATLPKYTGYISEYGLSKDQLDKRHNNMEKQQKVILEKNLKATECQIQKMEDNERAFTRWLKNKMKSPVNKTKNMFDFHQNKNAKKVKS